MSEPLLIPCPACNGLNRIPAERLGDQPKCGRCKSEVLLSKPFELKQGDYASQIKGDLPLLVDMWADWCGPCKSFAPVFEQAAAQLGIRSIPSLILFKNGREVARQSGAFPLPQLMAWLRSQGI